MTGSPVAPATGGPAGRGSNEHIVAPHELLARLAVTLRKDIGPAVGETFPRTQAFMAAVILEKLSAQLAQADGDAAASATDHAALVADLPALLGPTPPAAVATAVDTLAREATETAVSAVIRALYDERAALGEERFGAALARVRATLRAGLDRRLVVAR